jgi:hypothetical protein
MEFITFGCWNKDLCSKTGEPRNAVSDVMQKLNAYKESNAKNLKFIVVSGDNYYPEKKEDAEGKKTKHWKESDFQSGFDCLPAGVDIRILMGNHDLESTKMIDAAHPENLTEPCHIIRSEMAYSGRFDFRSDYKLFGENTILLFIDTSMYSKMSMEELQCYNGFLGSGFTNVQEAQTEQQARIHSVINDHVKPNAAIKNIIIVGHHPIFGIKKTLDKTEKIEDSGIEFFLSIGSLLDASKYSFYYLCADIHNYQHSEINLSKSTRKMKIEQHIVGTGGTDLDPLDLAEGEIEIPHFPENIPIEKVKIFEHKVRYGFLVCKNEGGTLTMKFDAADFMPVVKIKNKKDKKDKKEKKDKKSMSAKKSPRITKTFREGEPGHYAPLGGRRRKRTIKRRVRIGGTSRFPLAPSPPFGKF